MSYELSIRTTGTHSFFRGSQLIRGAGSDKPSPFSVPAVTALPHKPDQYPVQSALRPEQERNTRWGQVRQERSTLRSGRRVDDVGGQLTAAAWPGRYPRTVV
ncbi:hypothetical protein GCM10010431_80660 [Streptomyces kunmingensis]